VKLRRIRIERLPGIDGAFELDALGDGLNVIVGPNGIGKSRLCTAARALLFKDSFGNGQIQADAVFEDREATWHVERDGSLHRWQRGGLDVPPPDLPGAQLDGCFFLGLRDLLDASDEAGQDLANDIRRQMSGGFDLDAIGRDLRTDRPRQVGKKERAAVDKADQEIRRAERSQEQIAEQTRKLDSMEREVEEATRAASRLPHYDAAIDLLRLREEHLRYVRDLSELPEALADLDGKELERLDTIDEQLSRKRRERNDAEEAARRSQAVARSTRLEGPVDPSLLSTWRQRAENLAALEGRLEAARGEARTALERATQARRALGDRSPTDSGEAEAAHTIDDDFDLFALLRDCQKVESERTALIDRLELLEGHAFASDDERRLDALRRGVDALRLWLRAPEPGLRDSGSGSWPLRRIFLAVAAGLIMVGVGVSLFLSSTPMGVVGIAVCGIGIGLAIAGLLSRASGPPGESDLRARALQDLPESVEPPLGWSVSDVTERLREIEMEVANLDAAKQRARDRSVDRGGLEASLMRLAERGRELDKRRRALAERLGLEGLPPAVEMVDLARLLDAVRSARGEAAGAVAGRDVLEAQWRRALEAMSDFLVGQGEATPSDAASARAGMISLLERDRRWSDATTHAAREASRREGLDEDIAALEGEKARLFHTARLENGDRTGLIHLLAGRGRHRERTEKRDEVASQIKHARLGLERAGEAALESLDLERLDKERAALAAMSARRDLIKDEIVEITTRADMAREGHVLEDALSKRSAALIALRERRDRALEASAGSFLIDAVRDEYEANQRPRVLDRARAHFATFTHHRYELNVSSADGRSFVAQDTKSGRGVGLADLSDGTRAQLILSARLAFAEEAEKGVRLPLFLDEALDHSDPDRFHAIARGLARMVSDDRRQIFYLSNDPTDVERFRAAFEEEGCDQLETLDLGRIRGQASRVDGPAALQVEPLAPVPAVADQSAEEYATAIGVSRLHPDRDIHAQHVFYLLRDDLGLLHRLLEARIETVGQCRNLLRSGSDLARDVVSASRVGRQLEDRIALFENFCLAWREGRGKRVARIEVEESGAISEHYLDAVVEMAESLDGDPRRLLAALRDRKEARLKGFRTSSLEKFERFLNDAGYLDDRPILIGSAISERALATPAASRLTAPLAAELIHLWWGLSENVRTR
jgi:hypothetical protein